MKFATFAATLILGAGLAACSSDRDRSSSYGDSSVGQSSTGASGGIDQSSLSGGALDSVATQAERQELQVQVGDTVHFATDSSQVDTEGGAILQRQAQYMQKYPNLTFTIEGHCDERGTREYNLALGDRRATGVKSALVALGVSAARLQVVSYGKERPVAVGSTEAAWAQNRRAVTVVN